MGVRLKKRIGGIDVISVGDEDISKEIAQEVTHGVIADTEVIIEAVTDTTTDEVRVVHGVTIQGVDQEVDLK